ncbi:MAG: Rieske 2Fe-2S domain-containing protein, partial [Pyrinomonadaceae bacterium]
MARTLATEFYTDESWFELSKERIFARSWQLVAGPELEADLTPVTLLPRFLDETLLISKYNGSFRCLSNVCTHRGKILVEEPFSANLIRCAYHGRRFSLDGKFLSMPEFEGVEDFPSESDDLHPVAFAE